MRRKLLDNAHPSTAASLDALARLMRDQAKLVEARELVRQRQTFSDAHPDDWQTFGARSLAGTILFLQKNYAEAEPLLLSGYEGMEQRKERMPAAEKSRLKEASQYVAQLYEATGRADQAAQWRQKLSQSGPAIEAKQ